MSLTCKNTTTNPNINDVIDQNLNRDLGLSNIFNVNNTVSMCVENFTSPFYTVSGACCGIPLTATTYNPSGCTYNLSLVDDIDLTFDFYGSLQYTGYTGQFCYKLTSEVNTTRGRCFSYSGITGTTLLDTIRLSKFDNEYRLRTWNIFNPMTCYTGITIDTSQYRPIDLTQDCFLSTIVNPPKPKFTNIKPDVFNDISFVNQSFDEIVEGQNQLLLPSIPVNNTAVVSVNGVVLSSFDYTIVDSLITFTIPLESTDIVQVYYHKTNFTKPSEIERRDSLVGLEMLVFTGTTSGVTNSNDNLINWNNIHGRLEMFLTEDILDNIDPTITINGIQLAYNIDVFKSSVVPNKLNFSDTVTLNINDIISVYYLKTNITNVGDLGDVYIDTPIITWYLDSELSKFNTIGTFYVELAENTDTSYNTIINSGSTIYKSGQLVYSLSLGPITTTNISNYIYRVRFVKEFTGRILRNTYTTESISDNGTLTMKWNYINSTNF